MKSRWGMECNLFPDLILLSVLLLSLGIKNKNNKLIEYKILCPFPQAYKYTGYEFPPLSIPYFIREYASYPLDASSALSALGNFPSPYSLTTLGIVTIREGRYHQIKRMFGCYGAKVLELNRIGMGNLNFS